MSVIVCKPYVECCFSCSILVREKSNDKMKNYTVFITDKTDTMFITDKIGIHEHDFGLWTDTVCY